MLEENNSGMHNCKIPKNRGTQLVGNGIFRDPEGYELSMGVLLGTWSKDGSDLEIGGQ